jgi:predicted Zn-dependent peptidase
MTYHITTLPSGLRVATERLAGIDSVTVAVTVDVGSRFEQESEGGISHLLEHMAFKGTKRRNAQQIAEEMDMVGGNMNAYTSLENTVYHIRVLKDDVPLAVDMLADILQHSTFDEEELARERNVILQEIAMHYDSPDDLVFDYFSETAYPCQPLGRSILGKAERVATFTRKELQAYMGKHYRAPNMVVSAAGNIEHKAFVKLVEKHFTSLPTSKHKPAQKGVYKGGDKRTKRKLEQLHLMLGFKAVSFLDEDYYAWQVLAILLGGGMSSRLFQEVREKRGLAYTVQAFVSGFDDSGVLGIYAATAEEKGPEMLPVVLEEVMKLQQGVSTHELARAKNQIKASLLMSRESSSAIAEWIGRHILTFGRYRPAAEIVKLVDAVTEYDIVRIGKTIAKNSSTLTLATLGPQKGLPDFKALQRQLAS